jgi:DNA-binding NarL/FixJ family response regulator
MTINKPFIYIIQKEVQHNEVGSAYELGIIAVSKQYGLTSREQEILRLLAYGRDSKYIASTLYITMNTAKTHLKHIYVKMGVSTRQEVLDLIEESVEQLTVDSDRVEPSV